MDIEEISFEQAELFGEFPVIPQPQWEQIQEEIILETKPPKSDFQSEFEEGFI